MDLHLTASFSVDVLAAVPGIVVGILLIFFAILWSSPYQRWKARRFTLGLVIAAIAAVIVFG
ncbi:hypothetical protein [Glycomyces salinus]|uniref:hypothetical protein n=1 Tax=Glycomyces salinus TaxID=980294 RepID=UPI0018ECE447|nr:hypothetical protein [Glycomyces salinus]